MPVKQEPFDVGDTVVITVPFTDANDNPADPTTVAVKIKDPAGQITDHTGQLAHPEQGIYTLEYPLAESGRYFVRAAGTGAVPIASERSFMVRVSEFD